VNSNDLSVDDYEEYAEQFNPLRTDRRARRKRKPRIQPRRRERAAIVTEIVDASGLESGFNPTYQPSKYEAGWLIESLASLYDQQFITDVLAQVKGGKEASVYRCAAHESKSTAHACSGSSATTKCTGRGAT